tara:strand:- start:336 stop:860 length:525 start_codon:yes stop_codon:yes gene_type:complete
MKIRIRESKRLNEGTIDDLRDLGDDVVNVVIKLARFEQSTRDRIITNLGGMSKKACTAMITKWEEGPLGRGASDWLPVEKGFKAVADQPLRGKELDEGLLDWAGDKIEGTKAKVRAQAVASLTEYFRNNADDLAAQIIPGDNMLVRPFEKMLANSLRERSDEMAECVISLVVWQ